MDREQIKAIIDNSSKYDESKEGTVRVWLQDAYSKRMRWVLLNVCVCYFICGLPALLSAIGFFITNETKYQILCAAVFLFCSHWIGFVSVFGWVMMQGPRINREIKRLELRIAESIEMIKALDS